MDNQLIRQFGEEILSYRLRTARQKKRMQREDFEKQLLKLDRDRSKLMRWQKDLGYEPLIPPYQRGWNRSFVLRQGITADKDQIFFQGILDRINTKDWSHRKDFLIRRRRHARKQYVVKPQHLRKLSPIEFHRMKFSDAEKAYFHIEYYVHRWFRHSDELLARFVFTEPWRFVLKIQPNMIEKIKIIDAEIESAIKAIDNYLWWNNYRPKLNRLIRGSHKRRRFDIQAKYKDPFENIPLYRVIEETREEIL